MGSEMCIRDSPEAAWLLCRGVVVLGKALIAVRAHVRKFACAGRSNRDHGWKDGRMDGYIDG